MSSLTPEAQAVLQKYLALPLIGPKVNTPYFNNERVKTRAGLPAMVGKGTPEEIALEAEIMAKTKGFFLENATLAETKKFLCENNLGIDCSALVYYIVRYEGIMRVKKDLQSVLTFPEARSWWRKLIVKLRPSQNINVAVLGAPANSFEISKNEIEPGDLIFLWNTGLNHKLNHVLLVTEVNDRSLTYAHSFRWRNEGKYDHGVRTGTILWTDPHSLLLDDVWIEKDQTGPTNDTLQHALEAERFEIRRLNIFR